MEELKKNLFAVAASLLLIAAASLIEMADGFKFALFAAAYFICGAEVLIKAAKNISKGEIFDENFLMCIATLGAAAIGQYIECAGVMVFYKLGEALSDYAADRSRDAISELMDIRPDYANVKTPDGLLKTDPAEVEIGTTIVVKPGEKVPIDGIVISGSCMANTAALTGESYLRQIEPTDSIISGFIDTDGVIEIQTTKTFGESTVSKILETVENAASKKSTSERFITKFAKYYTPSVIFAALLLAVIPPLTFSDEGFLSWIYRALTFLVVSCPCALVISVPLSFFAGIGGASSNGILIKGASHLEDLAKAQTVIFDKTGTLTQGVFEVSKIDAQGLSEDELLKYAAYAEHYSTHPIAQCIKRAYKNTIDETLIKEIKEVAGRGVTAQIGESHIVAGNAKFMQDCGVQINSEQAQTTVYIIKDNIYAGSIEMADVIKADGAAAITHLKEMGIKKTAMLTGDNEKIAAEVAAKLGIDEFHAQLMPDDKVEITEKIKNEQTKNERLVFVGDGINDAPVLTVSDVGVAMGGLGSDAAIEAADIVLMTDEPSKLVLAIAIAKKTMSIAKQNILFAIGIKAAFLTLTALGLSGMGQAVFADVGVTVIAVLNSMRALSVPKKRIDAIKTAI